MKHHILLTDPIRQAAPHCRVGVIEAVIDNTLDTTLLWQGIDQECATLAARYELSQLNQRREIAATRAVYKALGKDPNRYRPSAEALCRRVLRQMPLYHINMVVDLINWVSMRYGFSIGGFDADQIVGDQLALGVGAEGEPFEAIGRGVLNVAGLPIYRDAVGGIGTPTSDVERTKLSTTTTHLLMLINSYSGSDTLPEAIDFSTQLLARYAGGVEIAVQVVD